MTDIDIMTTFHITNQHSCLLQTPTFTFFNTVVLLMVNKSQIISH